MTKRWVIPDIHGYLRTLKVLIEEQIQPSRQDEIYFLGDYIDRGPDSKGVIDYLHKLETDGYNVNCIIGNHEDFCVQTYYENKNQRKFLGIKTRNHFKKEWEKYGGKETQKSFGLKKMKDFPFEYIEWMKNLRFYIELEDYLLVHAGFNFKIEDPFTDRKAMIWVRDYQVDPEKINHKTVVHGHVPVSLEFMQMTLKSSSYHFISLDNGVYMDHVQGFGNLTALELNSKELLIQPNMDL
ncbi:MAG: metallophosphoesterase [Bacteroidales bacterium]|nr:metallophosphoesterase [Bacteroidales bacterium]MCF8343261.1 metallophosphoesterase [Bacteroidales bacterium]MCF8351299.1 metallophosphoesterase [Bacteroidales bacterium]MCF8376429.1 metallophosphoesterase [Bacteroidales bacterium]MCF8400548.1 metallophosphoesterase [Bacteroidales bacterium]